jgi:hypothetical protein
MNNEAIQEQSKAAYKQWAPQWRKHAEMHKPFAANTFEEFENIGVGRAVLCVANGYSFEEHISVIRTHQRNVDILACDKTMGHLLDNGITPTYVVVCDANVDYQKYMAKWKDQLSKTVLFINACANPEWSQNGNWKKVVTFVNKDVLGSEKEFAELSGTRNSICAGTNVSNAMVILLTQSDNEGRNNLFGYDKILLIGFDYSWKFGGKYYAFDADGGGKAQYMRHSYAVAPNGEFVYTSGNLHFSLDWLKTYISHFKLPVIQCAPASLLSVGGPARDLAEQMQYRYKPEDGVPVRKAVAELKQIRAREQQLLKRVNEVGRDHYLAFARSI